MGFSGDVREQRPSDGGEIIFGVLLAYVGKKS